LGGRELGGFDSLGERRVETVALFFGELEAAVFEAEFAAGDKELA
jgi:hypothetical protein